MKPEPQEVTFGHTPDADDAFMWFALSTGKIDVDGLKINHLLKNIQELNRDAEKGMHELSAISFGAYPYVADRYDLLPCGGCLGYGYGPILVARRQLTSDDLLKARIGVPGRLTTAFFTLRLFAPNLHVIELPFDQIVPLRAGKWTPV